MTKVKGRS